MVTVVRVCRESGVDLFEATVAGMPLPKKGDTIFLDVDNDQGVRVHPQPGVIRVHGVWKLGVVDTQYDDKDGCLLVDCTGTLLED